MKNKGSILKASACLCATLLLAPGLAAQPAAGNNSISTMQQAGSRPADLIRLNQVGYYPQQEKVAVVNEGKVDAFRLIDAATGQEVLQGKPAYTDRKSVV